MSLRQPHRQGLADAITGRKHPGKHLRAGALCRCYGLGQVARAESNKQASARQSLPFQLADMLQPLDARNELSARSLGVWVQDRTLKTQQPLGLLSADTTQGVTDLDGKGVGCIDDGAGTAFKHPRNGRVAEQRALVHSSHSQMAIGHGRGGCHHADLHPPPRGGQRRGDRDAVSRAGQQPDPVLVIPAVVHQDVAEERQAE